MIQKEIWNTSDLYFHQLCDEIDYWKDKAKYYKDLYEQEVRERNEDTNKRLKDAQDMTVNILLAMIDPKNPS